ALAAVVLRLAGLLLAGAERHGAPLPVGWSRFGRRPTTPAGAGGAPNLSEPGPPPPSSDGPGPIVLGRFALALLGIEEPNPLRVGRLIPRKVLVAEEDPVEDRREPRGHQGDDGEGGVGARGGEGGDRHDPHQGGDPEPEAHGPVPF